MIEVFMSHLGRMFWGLVLVAGLVIFLNWVLNLGESEKEGDGPWAL